MSWRTWPSCVTRSVQLPSPTGWLGPHTHTHWSLPVGLDTVGHLLDFVFFWPCLFCGWVLSRLFFSEKLLLFFCVGKVGQFLTPQCNQHSSKNENVSDKSLQYPSDFSQQGIHTLCVASSYALGQHTKPKHKCIEHEDGNIYVKERSCLCRKTDPHPVISRIIVTIHESVVLFFFSKNTQTEHQTRVNDTSAIGKLGHEQHSLHSLTTGSSDVPWIFFLNNHKVFLLM